MRLQYAIIGAGGFGRRILEELIDLNCEIILMDRDASVVEQFKNDVTAAYIADIINEEIITKLVPADIDAAVVDLGNKIEASILATQYLKKCGIKNIIVKAETDQHGEILSNIDPKHVRVVYPNIEAAQREVNMLAASLTPWFFQISKELSIAEITVPENWVGTTVVEINTNEKQGILVAAFRESDMEGYHLAISARAFKKDDNILIFGRNADIHRLTGNKKSRKVRGLAGLFSRLFAQCVM